MTLRTKTFVTPCVAVVVNDMAAALLGGGFVAPGV